MWLLYVATECGYCMWLLYVATVCGYWMFDSVSVLTFILYDQSVIGNTVLLQCQILIIVMSKSNTAVIP